MTSSEVLLRATIAGSVALAGCGGENDRVRATAATADSTTPAVLTLAYRGASNPTVSASGDVAWVTWVETAAGVHNVRVARIDDLGADADAAVTVNDIPGDAAPHAQAPAVVAAGPDGAVYVAWHNEQAVEGRRFAASDLRFAASADGGRTFGNAVYVNDDAGGEPSSHTFHDVAVGADGAVYVSWIDGRRGEGEDSHAHAGATSPGPDIRVARLEEGGFGAGVVVGRDACPCCRTALAAGRDGTVYLSWRQVFEGSIRDMVVARSEDGGRTFEAPVRVHADGWEFNGCPHAGAGLAVDGRGRVHIAWYTGAAGRSGLWYATSTDGGRSFGAPVRLTAAGPTAVSQVKIASAGDGVWLAWEEHGGDGPVIRLARSAGPGSEPVVKREVAGRLPELASSGSGVFLTWLDGEAVRVLRQVNRS